VNPEFSAVDIDYAAVAPMLIVVAGALIGVVVEAFAPRRSRHGIQVGLAVLTLVAAFVALVVWSRNNLTVTLGGSVVVDGVSVFLIGALLLMAALSVLIMAERFGGVGSDAFTPMGASTPGSSQEDVATRAGYATSEVFPAHAVRGARDDGLPHRQRPHHDVRRTRGALAAALRPHRTGAPPPSALAGGRAQVLPARRLLERVLPLRCGAALRLRRVLRPAGHRRRDLHDVQ
jgi:hypothetical protein